MIELFFCWHSLLRSADCMFVSQELVSVHTRWPYGCRVSQGVQRLYARSYSPTRRGRSRQPGPPSTGWLSWATLTFTAVHILIAPFNRLCLFPVANDVRITSFDRLRCMWLFSVCSDPFRPCRSIYERDVAFWCQKQAKRPVSSVALWFLHNLLCITQDSDIDCSFSRYSSDSILIWWKTSWCCGLYLFLFHGLVTIRRRLLVIKPVSIWDLFLYLFLKASKRGLRIWPRNVHVMFFGFNLRIICLGMEEDWIIR